MAPQPTKSVLLTTLKIHPRQYLHRWSGNADLKGKVREGLLQSVVLGRVSLQPGNFEIKVAPAEIKRGDLFLLRSMELKPVAANGAP